MSREGLKTICAPSLLAGAEMRGHSAAPVIAAVRAAVRVMSSGRAAAGALGHEARLIATRLLAIAAHRMVRSIPRGPR